MQARRLTRSFVARRHQQPFSIQPGGDEVLVAGQAQAVQAGVHVRRAHAAPLGGTQRTQAGRRAGPQHPQRRLVAEQERQPGRGHGTPAQDRQLERRHRAQALEHRRIGFTEGRRQRVAQGVVESLQPGHRKLLSGVSRKHHQRFTGVTPGVPRLTLHNKADRPQPFGWLMETHDDPDRSFWRHQH
ncbi:hypothetical protein EMIT047CA2_20360 [Pseudomonas soli]